MSTHAALGIEYPDGRIQGCYVHYDGATMKPRIEDFVEKYTTTGLAILIAQAQIYGGMRSFHCPQMENSIGGVGEQRETEFLDDGELYVIDELNWGEDHFGTFYSYLIDYTTGCIQRRQKY